MSKGRSGGGSAGGGGRRGARSNSAKPATGRGAKPSTGRGAKPSPGRGAKPAADRGAKPSAGRGRPGPTSQGGRPGKASASATRPTQKRQKAGKPSGPQGGGAQFIDSVVEASAVPEGPPEFAFVGRSNVGKSSLLNALSRHNSLARTSKTPGRTQRVNLFDVPLPGGMVLRFADLPGYGHARVPGAIRRTFGPMIENYLLDRRSLLAVCVLVDARRDPDEDTINFVQWLLHHELRVELVVTKLDKIPKNKRLNVLESLRKAHEMTRRPWATSTLSGDGVDTLRDHLRQLAIASQQTT